MKIYTGYFGRMRLYTGLQCIAISRSVPIGLVMPNLLPLNPTREILALKNNPEEYTKRYDLLLHTQDAIGILKTIEFLSHGKDVILLCYEKSGAFCHRHLVAKWLNKELGIEVTEYEGGLR